MRLILVAALAGLLLVPASASAARRFSGCVAESHGCTHRLFGGDLPVARFIDRQESHTAYRICVKDREGRRCWRRNTGKAGRWHQRYLLYRTIGRHVVRWYVNGEQVARWRFRVLPEGE